MLAVASALTLFAVACGDSGSASTGGGPPAVRITAPANDAQVGRSFDVHLEVNFPIGPPDTGRNHVHLYYDGNTAEGQYGIAYGDTFTVDGLSPGTHSIQAVVAHADHSTTSTRSEPITVHVSDSGATTAGAGTSGSSTPAGSGGLGY